MLAYRHLFHAGGFADVFKHSLLARFPPAFARKPGPCFYLDTHAGTGLYDLRHPWAAKTAEYKEGIARVWQRSDAPPELSAYLDIVRSLNAEGDLRCYPGSPEIVLRLRRRVDRMALAELNRTDYALLESRYGRAYGVSTLNADGFAALKSQVPPRERRGMVFIDPSFDQAAEFDRVIAALATAHRRWSTGTLAIWYPLMEPDAMRRFERRIVALGVRKILQLELSIHPEHWRDSLRGCGMLVVNPPFRFEREAGPMIAWLSRVLAPGSGSQRTRWLVPE